MSTVQEGRENTCSGPPEKLFSATSMPYSIALASSGKAPVTVMDTRVNVSLS